MMPAGGAAAAAGVGVGGIYVCHRMNQITDEIAETITELSGSLKAILRDLESQSGSELDVYQSLSDNLESSDEKADSTISEDDRYFFGQGRFDSMSQRDRNDETLFVPVPWMSKNHSGGINGEISDRKKNGSKPKDSNLFRSVDSKDDSDSSDELDEKLLLEIDSSSYDVLPQACKTPANSEARMKRDISEKAFKKTAPPPTEAFPEKTTFPEQRKIIPDPNKKKNVEQLSSQFAGNVVFLTSSSEDQHTTPKKSTSPKKTPITKITADHVEAACKADKKVQPEISEVMTRERAPDPTERERRFGDVIKELKSTITPKKTPKTEKPVKKTTAHPVEAACKTDKKKVQPEISEVMTRERAPVPTEREHGFSELIKELESKIRDNPSYVEDKDGSVPVNSVMSDTIVAPVKPEEPTDSDRRMAKILHQHSKTHDPDKDLSDSSAEDVVKTLTMPLLHMHDTTPDQKTGESSGVFKPCILSADWLPEVETQLNSTNHGDVEEAYLSLKSRVSEYPECSELLWRLAKGAHLQAAFPFQGEMKQRDLRFLAHSYARKAIENNAFSPKAHKWFAISIASLVEYVPSKLKIINACTYKKHADIALCLHPNDPVLHHMLGKWCLELSKVTWQDQIDAAPNFCWCLLHASVDDAILHLRKAHELRPKWKHNTVDLVKAYMQKREFDLALHLGKKALAMPSLTAEDETANSQLEEIVQALSNYPSHPSHEQFDLYCPKS